MWGGDGGCGEEMVGVWGDVIGSGEMVGVERDDGRRGGDGGGLGGACVGRRWWVCWEKMSIC